MAQRIELTNLMGTFEGYSFTHHRAIADLLTATDVVNWDHDAQGEAEFWPHGDHPGVALVFQGRTNVTANELVALDNLLIEIGTDDLDVYALIHHAISYRGETLTDLDPDDITNDSAFIYRGQTFTDLREQAAWDLFELYYPELAQALEDTSCPGVQFDPGRFLNSPAWTVTEIDIGKQKLLLVQRD